MTGRAICRVPATSGSCSPRARAVSMASSTTIELSTSMPAARARPASETTSSGTPQRWKAENAASIEAGTATARAQGGPPAPEHQPQHGDAQGEAEQRRHPERPQGRGHLGAAVRHHLDARARRRPAPQLRRPLAHPGGEGHGVGLRRAEDAHQGPLAAVEAEEGAVPHLLEPHAGHVAQHALAPRPGDAQGAQGVERDGVLPHQQGAHRRAGPRPAGGHGGAQRPAGAP